MFLCHSTLASPVPNCPFLSRPPAPTLVVQPYTVFLYTILPSSILCIVCYLSLIAPVLGLPSHKVDAYINNFWIPVWIKSFPNLDLALFPFGSDTFLPQIWIMIKNRKNITEFRLIPNINSFGLWSLSYICCGVNIRVKNLHVMASHVANQQAKIGWVVTL